MLSLHSFIRWIILICLVWTLIRSYWGWKTGGKIMPLDRWLNRIGLTSLYIQLGIGLYLYFTSPLVAYFLDNVKESIKDTQLRFFGMEHITAMIVAILMFSFGSYRAFRMKTDRRTFKVLAFWFILGFLILFFSIPWSFSPFTARPDFRFLG